MKAAFVTVYDAADVDRMSGTGFHIARALERQGADLHFIGPLRNQCHPANVARYLFNRCRGRRDHPQRDPGFLRHYARQVERRLQGSGAELVFGSGGLPIAYLETDLPVVVWTDCTFATLLDYYDRFSNLSARTIRDGHAAERNLYRRCTRAVFTSRWAADSAINDYGLDPARAGVVPRGANVPDDRSRDDVDALIAARPTDRCRLLFIGVDWRRKGGDVAVEIAAELNRRGLPTELRVVGTRPRVPGGTPEFVAPLGRIRKTAASGMTRLVETLGEAHFLILPTRAEAFGIVFCEAAGCGVPSLGTRTGGVATAIREDASGLLFDPDATPAAWADAVEMLFHDRDAYRRLARASFREYQNRLNWDVAGRRVFEQLDAALHDTPAPRAIERRHGRAA